MRLQRRGLYRCVLAVVAFVLPLLFCLVAQFMLLDDARIGRLKLTVLTGDRFFAGVLPQMDHVRDLPGGLMAAHVADERFDLAVNGLDVLRQHFGVGEHVLAYFAFLLRIPTHLRAIDLMVSDAVDTQLRKLFEHFRAIGTGESFRGAVDLEVAEDLN